MIYLDYAKKEKFFVKLEILTCCVKASSFNASASYLKSLTALIIFSFLILFIIACIKVDLFRSGCYVSCFKNSGSWFSSSLPGVTFTISEKMFTQSYKLENSSNTAQWSSNNCLCLLLISLSSRSYHLTKSPFFSLWLNLFLN